MKKLISIIAGGCLILFGYKATAQTTNGSINTVLNSTGITYNGTTVQLIPNATAFTNHGIFNLTVNNTSGVSSAGNSYINLWGTLTLTNGVLITAGSLYVYGSISPGSGQIQSGNYIVGFYGTTNSQSLPVNAFVNNTINTLYINNTSTGATVTTSGNLDVPGTLDLIKGTLALGGNLTIGGAVTYTAGGIAAGNDTVTFNGISAQAIPPGTFINNTLNNMGIANTAGIFFSGPFTFNSLTLSNLGTAPALNDAGQTTSVSGPLVVNSFSGTPIPGQTFVIDTAGTVSGTFSSLTLPSGYSGSINYTAQVVTLTLSTVPGRSLSRLNNISADTANATSTIFSIYPNPATGGRVTLLYAQASGMSYIKISNMVGKLMSLVNVAYGSTSTSLDVSGLRPGLYIVDYYNNGTVKTLRLLK